MSLYRHILSQAWQVTWQNKYLWFFGLFAVLIGSSGEYEVFIRGTGGDLSQNFFPNFRSIIETGVFSGQTFSNIGSLFKTDPLSMFILIIISLIIFALFMFLVWLAIVSQIALVNNSASIINGKKRNFRDGIMAGMKNFWPILGLNALIKIIIFFAFVLISLPIILSIASNSWQLANLLYIILFIIFIPAAISFAFMVKYAIAYVIIKNSSFFDSIVEGWLLFKNNWLVSIEMAFVLFFINFLVGLAIVLALLILAIPFLFLALLFYNLASLAGFWIVIMLGIISLLFIIIAGGAALATFQISSWTGLFLKLVSKGGTSKILRIVKNFKN
ncbi:MAG: hypothetical protein ABH830_04535 [Patescibacteria group bacterium]